MYLIYYGPRPEIRSVSSPPSAARWKCFRDGGDIHPPAHLPTHRVTHLPPLVVPPCFLVLCPSTADHSSTLHHLLSPQCVTSLSHLLASAPLSTPTHRATPFHLSCLFCHPLYSYNMPILFNVSPLCYPFPTLSSLRPSNVLLSLFPN